MVRIQRQRPASAAPAAMRHKELMNRNKPAYKVILEQVTQQKKKLITVVSASIPWRENWAVWPGSDIVWIIRVRSMHGLHRDTRLSQRETHR